MNPDYQNFRVRKWIRDVKPDQRTSFQDPENSGASVFINWTRHDDGDDDEKKYFNESCCSEEDQLVALSLIPTTHDDEKFSGLPLWMPSPLFKIPDHLWDRYFRPAYLAASTGAQQANDLDLEKYGLEILVDLYYRLGGNWIAVYDSYLDIKSEGAFRWFQEKKKNMNEHMKISPAGTVTASGGGSQLPSFEEGLTIEQLKFR
jgi:hypothetical protein